MYVYVCVCVCVCVCVRGGVSLKSSLKVATIHCKGYQLKVNFTLLYTSLNFLSKVFNSTGRCLYTPSIPETK